MIAVCARQPRDLFAAVTPGAVTFFENGCHTQQPNRLLPQLGQVGVALDTNINIVIFSTGAEKRRSSNTPKRVPTTKETRAMPKTKDALKIIDQMVGDDAELRQMIADENVNATIAQMIFAARTDAGLTQKELAERVGTKQPVIARLEDAEYEGHSLSMLNRIAEALNRRLRVEMCPRSPSDAPRPRKRYPSRRVTKR